jgi:hypothetical protein
MKTTELPALAELRESLREAAARDVAARRPRRRRRRGIAIFAAVLLGGAAAAGAADLISSGEPVPTRDRPSDPRYDSSGQLQLATKAEDTPLSWGVQIYTSSRGEECALLGRVRGNELGKLDAAGVFHRYPEGRSGACGDTGVKAGFFGDLYLREDRTVLYGRARPGVKVVTITADGKDYPVRTGLGGAFVIVFKGSASPDVTSLG